MTTVRSLAATGALGTGFREESLERAMQARPDVIGCDAGSTDPGPYYLASGESMAAPASIRRDLRLMLRAAVTAGVPLVIGSAGTGGGRPHLERTLDLVRDIAAADGLHFTLASIDTEIEPAFLADAWGQGRVHALPDAPDVTRTDILGATRIVAQMGAEPFITALGRGAQVVIGGRASDAAIFSAVPIMRGCGEGPAWHAAKILECGAAAVAQRLYPDCMMADVGVDEFTVWAPNPLLQCTAQSIASHTLYENADPYLITEASGVLDTTHCTYEPVGDGRVRVRGSRFAPKQRYDVKLEGVAHRGHRYLVPGGIRDPIVLRQLDAFLKESCAVVRDKVAASLGFTDGWDYRFDVRVYGRDACLGDREPFADRVGHEVGIHIDVVAPTPEAARGVATIAWHTMLHHPVPEWSGLISNLAFPYSPPEVEVGPVHEFMLHHVLELDDPLETAAIRIEDV